MNREDLSRAAAIHGLVLRGGFRPSTGDCVPALSPGIEARTLVLFGNAGSSLWERFSASDEYQDHGPDPLDRWSRRIGTAMARQFAGEALFPFGGPPWHPFVRWAAKAEGLPASRLGMLIHPRYGLWHAYRFALALPDVLTDLGSRQPAPNACDACLNQPCLGICPVAAFDGVRYDVEACFDYLESHPAAPCHRGCLARGACPEGADYRYREAHAGFHMTQFFLARQARRDP